MGRLQKHPRLWFVAGAIIPFNAIAGFDVVNGKGVEQFPVHGLDDFPFLLGGRDIRLVGGNDYKKSGPMKVFNGFHHTGQNLHFLECVGRIRLATANEGAVDNAISVQKDSPPCFLAIAQKREIPYQVVIFFCRSGCETRQCQITAWNASVCGVTWVGSTVGITTTTSPTLFV